MVLLGREREAREGDAGTGDELCVGCDECWVILAGLGEGMVERGCFC